MTADEYKKAIEKLGMTSGEAAKFFHVNETTSRRWISGKHTVPDSVAMTLTLMQERGIKPGDFPRRRKSAA